MKIKVELKSEILRFNVMPSIGGTRPLPGLEVSVKPDEVLPEGDYELEVGIINPEGKAARTRVQFRVSHTH